MIKFLSLTKSKDITFETNNFKIYPAGWIPVANWGEKSAQENHNLRSTLCN
jgi:hypothetical protein